MRILIDECLPRKIGPALIGHETQTVAKAGFAGKTNGELLAAAELAGFQVLLTVDKGIRHQQNLSGRRIAIVVIGARSNELEDLLPHVSDCLIALESLKSEQIVHVGI